MCLFVKFYVCYFQSLYDFAFIDTNGFCDVMKFNVYCSANHHLFRFTLNFLVK